MKPIRLRISACACVVLILCPTYAGEYQISGHAVDESDTPVDAVITVAAQNSSTLPKKSTRTLSNGTYALTISLPSGTVAEVTADRIGLYAWFREITLGADLIISNLNFIVPTVNTTKVSVAGRVTVGNAPPQQYAAVALKMNQAVNGQTLAAATPLIIAGIGGTNSYQFLDLPQGEYTLMAQADSSAWTQVVVTVTGTNVPITLDFDF